jgi:DNA-directed RNA polymerase subunit E'/Rpb7
MAKPSESIFVGSILTDNIKLRPNQLANNYRDVILTTLRTSQEGICTKHGYVKPGSIELYKVAAGKMRMISLNGDTIFQVQYKADVCNPAVGTILKAKVMNTNKFGILAEYGIDVLEEDGSVVTRPVVEVIITKQTAGIISVRDLNAIKICGIGRLVEAVGPVVKQANLFEGGHVDVDEDDDEGADDVDEFDDDDDADGDDDDGDGDEHPDDDGDLEVDDDASKDEEDDDELFDLEELDESFTEEGSDPSDDDDI